MGPIPSYLHTVCSHVSLLHSEGGRGTTKDLELSHLTEDCPVTLSMLRFPAVEYRTTSDKTSVMVWGIIDLA